MSARSENRYKAFARREADAKMPDHIAILVADLNAQKKNEGARAPFMDAVLKQGHGGWWMECPITGYGFWYKTIRAAVRAWRVTVYWDGSNFCCIPS